MNAHPPANPAGPFEPVDTYDAALRKSRTDDIQSAPDQLRRVVQGLNETQLDTQYRNWTVRQITHHIADSHLHVMIRFKWALTENNPTIKAYNEADWVQLADNRTGAIEPSLALLDGIHTKWVQVLDSLSEEQFERIYHHPETGEDVRLWTALQNYAWHSKHHTAQIQWLRDQHGW